MKNLISFLEVKKRFYSNLKECIEIPIFYIKKKYLDEQISV